MIIFVVSFLIDTNLKLHKILNQIIPDNCTQLLKMSHYEVKMPFITSFLILYIFKQD